MSRVLVVGDTHAPAMREGYVQFLQEIHESWRCDRVVHIGDLVDWHAISYHEKEPSLSSAEDEYQHALEQVAEIYEAFPRADWLVGNHDALAERQARSAGLPGRLLKSYTSVWNVPNWVAHPQYAKVEIDGVLYSHGDGGRGGKNAALHQAQDAFQSVVIGHLHSNAGVRYWANPKNRVFGMSTGCGVDWRAIQFDYGRRYAAKPILGCGVVIDGRQAYFEPWCLEGGQ